MTKPTISDIEAEQRTIEEEQDIINQRIISLKSMIAKYVEAQNDKNSK